MNKEKGRTTRMRLGRVLLSYGIVFSIGLWLGYQLASTGKAVSPQREDTVELFSQVGNEAQERGEKSAGEDTAGEAPSLEGEVVAKDDLSLTFYETLLEEEPPPKIQDRRGGAGETHSAAAPGKRESKSSKGALSSDAPFSIQVGSFAHKKQAEDLTQRLKRKGYPAYITSQVISGMGRMYQVRIGHYRTLDEAKRKARHIGKREELPTYIPLPPGR